MPCLTLTCLEGKGAKAVMQQTANDVDKVKRLSSPSLVNSIYRALCILAGNQLREGIHKWLSPPDPSTNHNIARDTHHKRAATWFFEGSIFKEWKATGSLLWIQGKRASISFPTCRPTPPDEILYS